MVDAAFPEDHKSDLSVALARTVLLRSDAYSKRLRARVARRWKSSIVPTVFIFPPFPRLGMND
jgi:hypothetical protein